jgi:hypothetical protein
MLNAKVSNTRARRDTFIITSEGEFEALKHLTERVDIDLPEGGGDEHGSEGSTSNPPTTEAGGNPAGSTGETSNAEHDGGETSE